MKKSITAILLFSSLTAIGFMGCSHKKTVDNEAQATPPPVDTTASLADSAPMTTSNTATATNPDDQVTQVASLGASSSGRSR